MDYSRSLAISAAGMAAERARVEVATLNLANANTVSSPGAPGFSPQRVVLRSAQISGAMEFGTQLAQALQDSPAVTLDIPEAFVQSTGAAPRLLHDPGHPLADATGMVAQPAVDTASEMVTIMSAMRSYEANVAAANAARTMALKALEIGGAS